MVRSLNVYLMTSSFLSVNYFNTFAFGVCSDWGRPGQLLPCKQSEPEATDMGAEPDCLCNWIKELRFSVSNSNFNAFVKCLLLLNYFNDRKM